MINYVASMNQNEKHQTQVLPIESLYDQVANSKYFNSNNYASIANQKIEDAIVENLKRYYINYKIISY